MIFSTLQYAADRDVVLRPSSDLRVLHTPGEQDQMEVALREHPNSFIAAEELDLVQAAERRQLFDKVLLLVKHGEEVAQVTDGVEVEEDPEALSGRGIGQALSLSRRMAAFCNEDTHLTPELVLVAPLKKVLQTTFLAFPYETPYHSIRNIPWICHPQTLAQHTDLITPEEARELQIKYSGVDYTLMAQDQSSPASGLSREAQLLQQADSLLDWMKTRDERVIVVSGEAESINAFGCRLNYEVGHPAFCDGELRAYGLHYTQ